MTKPPILIAAIALPQSRLRQPMDLESLTEHVFPVAERRMPLDQTPVEQLPHWGHWLETPDLLVAMLAPGPLAVNLRAPFECISTRFQPGYGVAAFDSDTLKPYQAEPGGFDVVPQGSTYRSQETTGYCLILAYKPPLVERLRADHTQEQAIALQPGQIQPSAKGTQLAQALQAFLGDRERVGGVLYLESLATLVMGYVMRQQYPVARSRYPDCLTPQQLKAVIDYIQSHLQQELHLHHLAQQVGLSPYYFARTFKATTGMPPHQYVLRCRLRRSQQLLRQTSLPIAAIAYDVGFGSQSHMTAVFRKVLGTTPRLYRQQVTDAIAST